MGFRFACSVIFVLAGSSMAVCQPATSFGLEPARPSIGTEADVGLVEGSLVIVEDGYSSQAMGEVHNNSDVPALAVRVRVAAFDDHENLISVDDATVYYADTCGTRAGCISSGEVGWFKAHLTQAYAEADHHQILVSGAESHSPVNEPSLELVGELTVRDILYGIAMDGEMQNTGTTDIVGVGATAVVRDPSGALLDISFNYHDGDRIGGYVGGLRAGESTPITLHASTTAADFGSAEVHFSGTQHKGGSFRYAAAGIAHQSGVGDSRWRSSVTATNTSGAESHLRLRFYHEGGVAEQFVDLSDGTSRHWDDVVKSLFGVSSEASGFVRVDADVPLTVTASTYNDGDCGEFSQRMPTVTPTETFAAMDGGSLSPIRGGPTSRTNIGFLNLSDQACSVAVRLYDQSGGLVAEHLPIRVEADSWHQLNDVAPAGLAAGYAAVDPDGDCSLWTYASVIDNESGDPTTIAIDPDVSIAAYQFTARRAVHYVGWSD